MPHAGTLLGEANWLRGLRDAWEAAGGWWQEQIVNFNRAKQLNLLEMLGLDHIDYGGMVLLLLAGGVLWALLLVALLKNREPRARRDALARCGTRSEVLQRRGVQVADHDGPEAIRRRAQQRLPEAADDIERFAGDYARLRFGGGNPADRAGAGRIEIAAQRNFTRHRITPPPTKRRHRAPSGNPHNSAGR